MTEQQSTKLHFTQIILQGVSTAFVIACFTFLWNINAKMTHYDDKISEHDKLINKNTEQIEHLQENVADHSVRLTRLEVERLQGK